MTLEQRAEAMRDEMELAFVDPRTTIGQIDDVIERHLRAVVEACAEVAENPYSDAVESLGNDEPSTVGRKIARGILREVGE